VSDGSRARALRRRANVDLLIERLRGVIGDELNLEEIRRATH
jgi:hypothetical protein